MAAVLELRREGVGIELRRARFEIDVDGETVGSIESHETVRTPIEPGHHTLRLRAGRYSSREYAFDAAEGEVVDFRCHSAMVWPRYVASIVLPGLGIYLKHEQPHHSGGNR